MDYWATDCRVLDIAIQLTQLSSNPLSIIMKCTLSFVTEVGFQIRTLLVEDILVEISIVFISTRKIEQTFSTIFFYYKTELCVIHIHSLKTKAQNYIDIGNILFPI